MNAPRLMNGLVATAVALADRAVITDIETQGERVSMPDGGRWYDIRPMLDERECPAEWIDMASEGLAYAIARGVIEMHPEHKHLVRIVGDLAAECARLSLLSTSSRIA